MINCLFCDKMFKDQYGLDRHLTRKTLCIDTNLLYKKYKDLHNEIKRLKENTKSIPINIESNNNNINSHNNNTININVNINPITKLEIGHLDIDKIQNYIENYKKNDDKLNLFLKDYIKDIICHEEHPENHAVKYIKKTPPTYNTLIEKDGETIGVINGLKDTCELLSLPVLDTLKIKLKEFLKKIKKDEEFDYSLYDDTIEQLKYELNKTNVKKALNSVLQHDILYTIKMKFGVIM